MVIAKLINLAKIGPNLRYHKFIYNTCKIMNDNVYMKLSMKKYEKVITY